MQQPPIRAWRWWTAAVLAVVPCVASSCDPYGDYNDDDDDILGAVDPVVFPAANLGVGGDRKRPGRGRFTEVTAFVAGEPVGYFSYPLPMLAAGTDPLRVRDNGMPYAPVATPPAYVFDAVEGSPFPPENMYNCRPPNGYVYDQRRDEVDYRHQGNVFSALPTATYAEGFAAASTYVPVVSEVRLDTNGRSCQQIKSEAQITKAFGMKPPPGGNFLAWLIIDPSAPVYPREAPMGTYVTGHPMAGMTHNGMGLQRWGWYNRYLLAYLDGGYIPTEDTMVMGGTAEMPTMRPVTRMRPQRLFIPRQVMTGMMMGAGRPGAGYDVLEFRRGQPGYSPICQVWVYGDPMMPPPAAAALPRSAADITGNPALNAAAASPASYVYCLQVR